MELNKLKQLWDKFGDTPIDENEDIDEPFLHFEKGTSRYDIWHWFEEQNDKFIIGELF